MSCRTTWFVDKCVSTSGIWTKELVWVLVMCGVYSAVVAAVSQWEWRCVSPVANVCEERASRRSHQFQSGQQGPPNELERGQLGNKRTGDLGRISGRGRYLGPSSLLRDLEKLERCPQAEFQETLDQQDPLLHQQPLTRYTTLPAETGRPRLLTDNVDSCRLGTIICSVCMLTQCLT